MHPVFHGCVSLAFIECTCRQDQDEISGPLYTLNQFVLKFSSLQLLHIYEDAVSSNLQMNLQKALEGEHGARGQKTGGDHFPLTRLPVLTWPAESRWFDDS